MKKRGRPIGSLSVSNKTRKIYVCVQILDEDLKKLDEIFEKNSDLRIDPSNIYVARKLNYLIRIKETKD